MPSMMRMYTLSMYCILFIICSFSLSTLLSAQKDPLSQEALKLSFLTLIGEGKGGKNKERDHIRPQDRAIFHQLSTEYREKIHLLASSEPQQASIPKKLHIIWIGPKQFPKESIANVKSWHRMNPDWKIYFWTDSETRPLPIPQMKRRLVDTYDFFPLDQFIPKTTNWGEKSDLMRFIILYREGGVYADHDAKCLRSFAPLLDHFSFFACLERPHYHESIDSCVIPANGLFGTVPRHVILSKTIDRVIQVWDEVEAQFPNDDRKSNFQRVIRRTFDSFALSAVSWRDQPGYTDILLPTAYFYPDKTFTKSYKNTLKALGIIFSSHKFAGVWRTKFPFYMPERRSPCPIDEYTIKYLLMNNSPW